MPDAARVALVTLGGTIASTGEGREHVVARLSGEDLVASVPTLAGVAEIEVREFARRPSGDYTLDDLVALAHLVAELTDAGHDGVVLTMGTDTMEEVAWALDLLVARGRPVVVTGAMRHPESPGADGPANLDAAVRVASDPRATQRGVLVVMNDEVHAARYVRKSHATSPAAFTSAPSGPVGSMVEGAARWYSQATPTPVLPGPVRDGVPAVALWRASLGDDGRILESIPDLGYEGLVVEAFGAGHVPARVVESLVRVNERIPVVFATRTGAGSTVTRTYGYPGSESDLLARGLIGAGGIDGLRARILLALTLASAGRAAVAEVFRAS